MKKNPDIKPKDFYLWNRVARTVAPLKKGRAKSSDDDFAALMRAGDPPVKTKPRPTAPLSQRADKKTRRGQISIDAKIDLHGMTQSEAFEALQRSLIRSYNRNRKCILVITGKGFRGEGVLKQKLPLWLEHSDIRPMIAEFSPAHIRHGGSGAFYVFLRR